MVEGPSVDERGMRRALFHAARGQGRTTPNPMVGAVVLTAEGVVVGQGYHERAGDAHAEVRALEEAGDRARGATLYVTLEPCCHVGRTGPCTRRIIDAGIARVVAAMKDPDPRVSGRGFAELRAAGVAVDEGLLESEARRLNRAFIVYQTYARPMVMLKAALTIDACVAAVPGQRTPISGPEAHRKAHRMRAAIDAIAVGAETLRVDDPLLTARGCHRLRPLLRVIFDRRLRVPPSARVFATRGEGPIVIVTAPAAAERTEQARALESAGAELLPASSLAEALGALAAREVTTLLVEGGPTLQGAFVRERLVDQVHLIVAPHAAGPAGLRWLDTGTLAPASYEPVRVEPLGADTWIEADVHGDR